MHTESEDIKGSEGIEFHPESPSEREARFQAALDEGRVETDPTRASEMAFAEEVTGLHDLASSYRKLGLESQAIEMEEIAETEGEKAGEAYDTAQKEAKIYTAVIMKRLLDAKEWADGEHDPENEPANAGDISGRMPVPKTEAICMVDELSKLGLLPKSVSVFEKQEATGGRGSLQSKGAYSKVVFSGDVLDRLDAELSIAFPMNYNNLSYNSESGKGPNIPNFKNLKNQLQKSMEDTYREGYNLEFTTSAMVGSEKRL